MTVVVDGKEYTRFSRYSINQRFGAIASTFSLTSYVQLFDDYLSYPTCEIYNSSGSLILTGTIFAPPINLRPNPTAFEYSGYSLPGVLEDCSIPKKLYPLQYDNLSLLQITEKMLDPFDLGYNIQGDITSDLNKSFTKVTADPGTTVKQFINNLASQRNIYLSHNEFGELLFMRYDPKTYLPTAYYEEGKEGLREVNLSIDAQRMHSSITVVRQATKKNPDSAEYTIQNPYISAYRPIVHRSNSGDIYTPQTAARNALSEELSNIKFKMKVTKAATAGTTIELKAPSLNLNESTELFIDEVQLDSTVTNEEDYTITCVPPDTYTDNTDIETIFS